MYGAGDQPSGEGGHQVDAREPLPLAVRLEQLGCLPAFDPPAPEAGADLDEGEVPDEAPLRPAEAFETDDPDRPRPEAALALEAVGDRRGRYVVEALEVELAANADQPRTAAGMEAVSPQLGGREAGQVGRVRRGLQAVAGGSGRSDDASLDLVRAPRLDQLAAERAQERMRDGVEPHRSQPGEPPDHVLQERVAREPSQERRMVVVEREHEAQALEPVVARGSQDDAAVSALPRGSNAPTAKRGGQQSVAEAAGRVSASRQSERVRTARLDDRLDHGG